MSFAFIYLFQGLAAIVLGMGAPNRLGLAVCVLLALACAVLAIQSQMEAA